MHCNYILKVSWLGSSKFNNIVSSYELLEKPILQSLQWIWGRRFWMSSKSGLMTCSYQIGLNFPGKLSYNVISLTSKIQSQCLYRLLSLIITNLVLSIAGPCKNVIWIVVLKFCWQDLPDSEPHVVSYWFQRAVHYFSLKVPPASSLNLSHHAGLYCSTHFGRFFSCLVFQNLGHLVCNSVSIANQGENIIYQSIFISLIWSQYGVDLMIIMWIKTIVGF